MDLKYLLKIFIIVFLILSIILFLKLIRLNFKENKPPTVLLGSVTIEGLQERLQNNEPLIVSGNKAFCQKNTGFNQEIACNKLTNNNCNLTSCCIWTNDNKCKAGNASGALFNSDSKGKTIPLDYYYFQNKCYGNNCP
jgi:hypothetical protein